MREWACCEATKLALSLLASLIFLASSWWSTSRPIVATMSRHSSRWNMDGATREIWAVGEAHPCAAWKLEGGEITTILVWRWLEGATF